MDERIQIDPSKLYLLNLSIKFINKLKELEKNIKEREWRPKCNNRLWNGADVTIAYKRTYELTAWELDDHSVIDGDG